MMKRAYFVLMGCLISGWADAGVLIKQVDLAGNITAKELALEMKFEAEVEDAPARLKVLGGAVVPTGMALPRGAEMVKEEGAYYIIFSRKGKQSVSIDFETKVAVRGQRHGAVFSVPEATIRQITLQADKAGYRVVVMNASRVQKLTETHVQSFLPGSGPVQILWSPELEKLSGDLVASCDTVIVGSAKVGALQLQGQYTYTIPQGRMKELSLNLPDGLNIVQVTGDDLLSWDIREEQGERRLLVELSRPHEQRYALMVQAEQSLPEFPCSFDFPVIEPQNVIRANGVVLVGTDSTIKLLVDELSGVTQVEPDAVNWSTMNLPKRGLYAYMFANMPFSMKLTADNIVTSLHAQNQLVLALSENDAALEAKIDLEVRDAPARDAEVEIPNGWTVTGVSGRNVADYDVRDRDGSRLIKIYFKKAVDSRTLIQVRFEKTLPEGSAGFAMPTFRVVDAKSERGFLVLRGETGTRLEGADLLGLREVNTGSLPIKIADAQQAFRFKSSDWSGRVNVRQEIASVHAESFQLVSLGESGVFGSSLITYNIANAPIRSFQLKIPVRYRNVEVHGRDIRNWTQTGEAWTVHLQQKVIGDYTLLVTYDHPANYKGEELSVGGVQTVGVENETGYIALAGGANLSVAEELERSPAILPIDVDEIPAEYALLVNDPIMHAYKYVADSHEARVQIKRFATQQQLTQVADHITLNTTVSKNGEAVTVAVYHVKNTDRQYLPIRLPENASLWSVKVNDDKIQVLDKGDGQVLIPVERRRDPNSPLKIVVSYAEQLNEPGRFSRMKFTAPQVDAQSVFARWAFQLPAGKHLISAGGNMEQPEELTDRRVEWGGLGSRYTLYTVVYWLCLSAVLCFGLFFVGRYIGFGKLASFGYSAILLGTLIAAMAVAALLVPACSSLAGSHGPMPAEWVFSKSVSGSDGLVVGLTVADSSVGLARDLGLLLVGLVPITWMLIARKRRLLIPLLALLTVLYSFSLHLAWLTLALPHLLLFYVCFIAGYRIGLDTQKVENSRRELVVDHAVQVSGSEGFVDIRLVGAVLLLMVFVVGSAALQQPQHEALAVQADEHTASAESALLRVTVPEFEGERRVSVSVHMELALSARKGDTLQLAGPDIILKDYALSSRRLSVVAGEEGSYLQVEKDGEYNVTIDYLVAAEYAEGEWQAALWIPDALKNSARIQLPVAGWDLTSGQAVRIRQNGAEADVLFDPRHRLCELVWKPEERKTDLEQSRFFCDVNTFADFRPGMVGLVHDVRLNIAQGEVQNLQFDVPSGMSVTEVHGENIGTWRYDPESGLLEVVLSAPASKAYEMQIGAQIAREKLPYHTVVQGIAVRNTAVQRGVVAFAASDAVQIDIGAVDGLSGINVDDAARLLSGAGESSIKRAFRYNHVPFSAAVAADQVMPELRLQEETSLDVASEQVRLSCRLNVTVSKSGIFSLRIRIPDGFDVDSLSGDAVSHWDEVGGERRELVINFARQITGTIPLNLVLSRSGRDLESEFNVPRIQVDRVLKHTGTLAVTVERGIRVTPVARDGVSEISPRELGIRQAGSLAYRLLRPDWKIGLQSEVMAPKLKAEMLQRIALSEGMLKVRCYLQYDIEYAGVKSFRLQSPRPDISLVVSGRNISRVRKTDDAQGIWEVELHSKEESRYGMELAYQVPFAHDNSELGIEPLRTLGTESQKGYVAVMSGGRLQVTPALIPESLRPEDARSIPRSFGAGDLADAVLCYRVTERDFELKLNVVRHNAADVLPAQVKSVRLDSVITTDDRSLNNMVMNLEPGSLRFLEMRLPENTEIWSVFVNETAVRPLVDSGLYLIPIEPGADLSAVVEVMYAQTSRQELFGKKHTFSGPQFKLPLMDVRWTFYAPAGYGYTRFNGTMQYQSSATDQTLESYHFDEDQYDSYNYDNSRRFGASAKENIVMGNEFMQSGDQRNARKAFRKAISYSQGQQALNEDARVQFRNLVRQQGVVGLVNRRNNLKLSLNQVDGETPVTLANEKWSEADLQKIEAQLGEKESSALSTLAEKMLDQQQAASVDVHPIRVVMARHGARIIFDRTLQLKSDTEMQVEFRSARASGDRSSHAIAIVAAVGMLVLSGGVVAKVRRPV